MVSLVRLAVFGLLVSAGWGATFGTVQPIVGGASDLVLDEARRRLYLVNPALNQVEIYSIPQRRLLSPIKTSRQPVAAAMSRNGLFLYVTCYDGSALDILDLEKMAGVKSVSLPAKPEGVAVGKDERVLITTIGTGAGNQANTLLIYDPQATESRAISNVVLAPPPPGSPLLPPPSGRAFLSYRSQLLTTRDGDRIIGLNIVGSNRLVFVYDVASATVLRSRQVGSISTVLSLSPDGSKFMAGLSLFDTETLAVLAQQNAANAPFVFPTTGATNFNTQQNQGGSVFSPDGAYLFTAFNIAPTENPPARANISQLLVNDPDNLLILLGISLPENVVGKFVITSDGAALYALSESGLMTIPLANLQQSPIAMPESQVVLLKNDQCGVLADSRTARVTVRNAGGGRLRATASLLQLPATGPQGLGGIGGAGAGAPGGNIVIIIPQLPVGGAAQPGVPVQAPGQPGQAATTQQQNAVTRTAPLLTTQQTPEGTSFQFTFNANAAASPGTLAPPHTFLIQSPDAVNIPPTVRVYQNHRNSEASADVIPVELGTAILEGLVDLVNDVQRQRLYIANSALNRVEVFDMRAKTFLAPLKVGQLPRSLALAPDGNTLYVANTGGESISIVDLGKGEVTGRVKFPPTPFNASVGVLAPQVIAAGLSGLQIVMNDGRLWQVIGDTAVPRGVSQVIGADSSNRPRALPAPRNMVATPNGEYILLLDGAGNAYLYDAMVDEFVANRQLFTRNASSPANALQGLYGAVAAGPRGQYFLANGLILNQSLTPVGAAPSVPGPAGRGGAPQTFLRPVAAVTPVGATTFARLSQPVRFTANAALTETHSVEIVDVNTGNTLKSVFTVEGPLQSTAGPTGPLTAISGRTMAVDAAGSTAYVLTSSGLSVVPLEVPPRLEQPQINPRGLVSMASYQPSVAPGQLVSMFGRNLGVREVASTSPLPTFLGGVCVTANNRPLPLLMTSPLQINAQIPPEFAAGRYTVQVRSVSRKTASTTYALTVSKYAPAVFVDPETGRAAIYHADGSPVTPDHPAQRDERLVLYATGLGITKGGKVTGGLPAPASPLAVTDPVEVFFGRSDYRQAEMVVEWSGLVPGLIGINQINLYVPGDRMRGADLPVTVRIGGVNSPQTGPVIPQVAVE